MIWNEDILKQKKLSPSFTDLPMYKVDQDEIEEAPKDNESVSGN